MIPHYHNIHRRYGQRFLFLRFFVDMSVDGATGEGDRVDVGEGDPDRRSTLYTKGWLIFKSESCMG